MKKITRAAIEAKKDGYKYMTSVVKSYKNTTYHHVVDIDRVINNDGWIPAPFNNCGWSGRIGIATNKLPEGCINKSDAIREYAIA